MNTPTTDNTSNNSRIYLMHVKDILENIRTKKEIKRKFEIKRGRGIQRKTIIEYDLEETPEYNVIISETTSCYSPEWNKFQIEHGKYRESDGSSTILNPVLLYESYRGSLKVIEMKISSGPKDVKDVSKYWENIFYEFQDIEVSSNRGTWFNCTITIPIYTKEMIEEKIRKLQNAFVLKI